MALELVDSGNFFDLVKFRNFDESLCRFYFKQMLQALDYMHSQGFAHRDLKLENILLQGNFNVKIADFGFAVSMEGIDGDGLLYKAMGSKRYMAPELFQA
jgi:carbon catabolite-derepressing protein kinase